LDGNGRSAQVSLTFNVDNTEPALTLEGPFTGAILDGTITVSAIVDDVFADKLQYSVDGIGWEDLVDGEATFDSSRFADGEHTITVRAVDASGKSTEVTSIITIDNNNPSVAVADLPMMGEHVAGSFDLAIFVDDLVGVDSVEVAIGNESWPIYVNPATGFHEWTFDTTEFADGSQDIVFTAKDTAGHNWARSPRTRPPWRAP
jgi:hypothetical protein